MQEVKWWSIWEGSDNFSGELHVEELNNRIKSSVSQNATRRQWNMISRGEKKPFSVGGTRVKAENGRVLGTRCNEFDFTLDIQESEKFLVTIS